MTFNWVNDPGPPILEFTGEHAFLSNFWRAKLTWGGFEWPHAEAAYQAAKGDNLEVSWNYYRFLSPGEAKKLGRRLPVTSDWNDRRDEVMYDVLHAKFSDTHLRALLLATGARHIEEGNLWNDRYWGVCPPGSGNGKNKLGVLLMRLRKELQGE
jgi:hypothetical protein